MKFLKCVIVFFIFVLIVLVPWIQLLANAEASSEPSDLNETVKNLLTMAGGGGIGVAGNELIKRKKSADDKDYLQNPSPLHHYDNSFYKEYVDQVKAEIMKELNVLKKRQKALYSKINSIEFFLGKKYDDFNRKDTLH